MANNNLFGTLQTPLKPIHYTGIDTKTVDIIVDAENRTIQANLQPDVLNVISGNVSALKSAYEKLTALSKEIDQVKSVITTIYNELNNNIYALKGDIKTLDKNLLDTIDRLTNIETDYEKTGYDIETYVDGKIEDKILELQEGTLELKTYAKLEYVDGEIARLEANIGEKADSETVETSITDICNRLTEINTDLDETNLRIDTFATKEELDAVQDRAGKNSILIMSLDSELVDITATIDETKVVIGNISSELETTINNINTIEASLLDTYATKEYVADEISKIDSGDISLDDYYNKSETETKIEEALNAITFITASIDSI